MHGMQELYCEEEPGMRRIGAALFVLMLLFVSMAAADTMFVDNQEADPSDLMRLNMRSKPAANGPIIASFYTGAEVLILETEVVQEAPVTTEEGEPEAEPAPETDDQKDQYAHVEIGGIEGYMLKKYLISGDEAVARYGTGSAFGECRSAEVDLTGMWVDYVKLLDKNDTKGNLVDTIADGEAVHMVGIVGNWAYIYKIVENGKEYGYVPLDTVTETGALKTVIVSSGEADSRTMLYETPSAKGKTIMSIGNGTACFMLFGRGEGDWRRVRVGGVSGWVNPGKKNTLISLGDSPRSSIPYYPLVMETKDDCLLYSVMGDKGKPYMTLGSQMKVEVLAETQNYLYVRTLIGGAGAYDTGDFGYIALSDLTLSQATSTMGVVQADDGDLPVLVYRDPEISGNILGALCGGAQVRLLEYTQTDYVRIAMDDMVGYVEKSAIRILTQEGDPLSDRISQRGTTKQNISLMSEPNDKSAVMGEVQTGNKVYILGKFGDWLFVNADYTPNLPVLNAAELTGFVRLSELSAPASTWHLIATAKTDKVNLRSVGDKTGDIIGRVRLGEILRVADYGTQWTCVVTPDGKRGYIMTEYLNFQ